MLPACRTASEGFAMPAFDVVPRDVGVARQDCGSLGKVDNCQGGVCAA